MMHPTAITETKQSGTCQMALLPILELIMPTQSMANKWSRPMIGWRNPSLNPNEYAESLPPWESACDEKIKRIRIKSPMNLY